MSDKLLDGTITRLTGGFYTVATAAGAIETRARGLFRHDGVSPCVGDRVAIELTTPGEGYITELKERKNILTRPPVANIDQLMMVVAAAEPGPNLRVIDKLLTVARFKDIPVVMVLTKTDIASAGDVAAIYKAAGYRVIECDGENMDAGLTGQFRSVIEGRLTALCGNTGVGKSSLLNRLSPELQLKTGIISKSLGRGKHTTRHVELFPVMGGLVADTPGFSSIEIERVERISKEELPRCFMEFDNYIGECKFADCTHASEPGCAIRSAAESGEIPLSRYESYTAFLEDAKKLRSWEK